MAIFRCHSCKFIQEVANTHIGQAAKCPQCQTAAQIHNTTTLVARLFEHCLKLNQEVRVLRQSSENLSSPQPSEKPDAGAARLNDIDIFNSDLLNSSSQHQDLLSWLSAQNIKTHIDSKSIDTSGFFDEVALAIGNNYETYKPIIDQIRFQQRRNGSQVSLNISKYSQRDIKDITQFCRTLYKHSFVAKFYYQKQEKIIRLTLQQAESITRFFAGEWLEWYVFIRVLDFVRENELNGSCLRSINVTLPNGDRYELDVFLLLNGQIPVCIECKTGEFRQQIDKFVSLKKRLQLQDGQFVVCVLGLDSTQAQGLSSMYGLTFANEANFIEHIEKLLAP